MTVKAILTFEAPELRQRCEEITDFDDVQLIIDVANMRAALEGARNGAALAAPQIGIMKRIVVAWNGSDIETYVNPEIVAHGSKMMNSAEECLSLPGQVCTVRRWKQIKVRFQDLDGRVSHRKTRHFQSRMFQHEIDHLDGILMSDKQVSNVLG